MKYKNIPVYRKKITFQSPFQSVFLWNVMECYGMRKNGAGQNTLSVYLFLFSGKQKRNLSIFSASKAVS